MQTVNFHQFRYLLSIRHNFKGSVVMRHNNVLSTRLHFLGGLASAW